MTDVWAFGVTLWEIYTYGRTPYPELSWDASFVLGLIGGLRLEKPNNINDTLYTLMMKCWSIDAALRLTFTQLKEDFNMISGT